MDVSRLDLTTCRLLTCALDHCAITLRIECKPHLELYVQLSYKSQSDICKPVWSLTGHSTVYQLIDLYHQIAQSFDHKTHTCVVFCDISKAFGTVDYFLK